MPPLRAAAVRPSWALSVAYVANNEFLDTSCCGFHSGTMKHGAIDAGRLVLRIPAHLVDRWIVVWDAQVQDLAYEQDITMQTVRSAAVWERIIALLDDRSGPEGLFASLAELAKTEEALGEIEQKIDRLLLVVETDPRLAGGSKE